jgi:hypothetical protein
MRNPDDIQAQRPQISLEKGKNVLYTGNRAVKPRKNHGELNCDAEYHFFVKIPNDSGILLVRSIRKRKR